MDATVDPSRPAGRVRLGGVYRRYPAIKDDQLYFIYTGQSGRHGMPSEPTTGLTALRLDGFVSVETEAYMPSTLLTRSHQRAADALHVNVEATGGVLSVQLQDETGEALDGFSHEECDPISVDAVDAQITWRGRGDLTSLAERTVAISFKLTPEAKLHSYTLRPTEAETTGACHPPLHRQRLCDGLRHRQRVRVRRSVSRARRWSGRSCPGRPRGRRVRR